MAASALLQSILLLAADVSPWWRRVRIPTKVAAAASMLVVACMVYLGVLVTGHVRDSAVQRSAAAVAHYMHSFVDSYAQELATRPALSAETREALERLLSPAKMQRPIVAFRIWKGDTVVFSNERDIVGKTIQRTPARERALQGQVAVEFDQPDGDDDDQVLSLKLPILEVYAPVRERGTGRVIALVETYEVAVALKSEILAVQLEIWIAVVAVALTLILLLASMANTGNSLLARIAKLAHLRAESERGRQRIGKASLQVSEMNERTLQRLGSELCEGPAQLVALAMLKFDSLEQLVAKAKEAMPSYEQGEDLAAIRQALNDALRHIRCVAGRLPLPDIEPLSVVETLAMAARRHEHLTGVAVQLEAHALPEQLPFPVKACLYRFALESLDSVCASSGAQSRGISAACDSEGIVVRTFCGQGAPGEQPRPLAADCAKLKSLRDRMEAVGAHVAFRSTATRGALIAELSLPTGS